jgi:hypothetical protein
VELEAIDSRVQLDGQKRPATYSGCFCVAREGGSEVRLDHAINFGLISTGKEGKARCKYHDCRLLFTKCRLRNSKRHVVSPDSRNPSPIRKLPTLQPDPQISKPPARSPKFRSSYPILKPLIYYRTVLTYRPLLVLAVVLACLRARYC